MTHLIDSPSVSSRGGMHPSGSSVTQKSGNEPAGWCDHVGSVWFRGAAPLCLRAHPDGRTGWDLNFFFWNRGLGSRCVLKLEHCVVFA